MAKDKSQNITCPCCKTIRGYEKGTFLPVIEAEILRKNLLWWGKPGWAIAEAKKGTLQWACRQCIKQQRAIMANPDHQLFLDYPPYLAYFDEKIICEDCDTSFFFSAKEQQFWYEKLQFWVQSRPNQCPTCRHVRRERRQEQQTLQMISDNRQND